MAPHPEKIHSLKLSMPLNAISQLSSILQSGIVISCPGQASIFQFILSLPGFDADYLGEYVQTIFLDGNAVDNFEAQLNKEHHVLALSAAMPGLAGAIFRKNSQFATLRKERTVSQGNDQKSQQLKVTVKLFNTIARDKGIDMLTHGGQLSGKVIVDYFKRNQSILNNTKSINLNELTIDPTDLLTLLEIDKVYFFKVIPTNEIE